MHDSEVESETGSMLMLKYESRPKMQYSRRRRNINNFKHHMQSLSENIDPCYFEENVTKSTFQKVCEDPEQLELVHKFFKLSEENQNKVISSLNTISEEIDIDDEPSVVISDDYEFIGHTKVAEVDGFCYVYQSSGRKIKHYVKNGLNCLSKEYIRFLQRQHPSDVFQDIENQLRIKFQENIKSKWQADNFTPYQRYITHIIAKYLGLLSESFNNHNCRVIRVSNPSCVFEPPNNFLYQEMENNIHVF